MTATSDTPHSGGDPTAAGEPTDEELPTSFFAGIGNCIWDEIKALWDLAAFFLELSEDFDIAADGRNRWAIFSSPATMVSDAISTTLHISRLESGAIDMEDFGSDQQQALQRVYAKIAIVRDALEDIMDAGINMIAAYDRYVDDTNLRYGLPMMVRTLLSAIAEGYSMLYTEAEWSARAAEGRAAIEQFVATIRQEFEARPWYAAGYAICLIAITFIPISRVTAAIRAIRPALRAIDAATSPADIAASMRSRGLSLPENIGGPARAADPPTTQAATPDVDPETRPTPTPEPESTSSERVETRDDAAPERAEDPSEGQSPEPDAGTTTIRGNGEIPELQNARGNPSGHRSNIAGDLAEQQARQELAAQYPGAQIETLSYGGNSNRGVDHLVIFRDDSGAISRVINVEVKSRDAGASLDAPIVLRGQQARGPLRHLRHTFENMDPSALRDDLQQFLDSPNPNVTGEVRGYVVNPETGAITGRTRQVWTEGTASYNFDLDTGYNGGQQNPQQALSRYLQRINANSRQTIFDNNPELRDLFNENGTLR